MAARNKKQFRPAWRYVVFGAIMLVGLGLGLLATYMAGWQLGRGATLSDALASQATIKQAEQTITAQYIASSTKDCVSPTTNEPYNGTDYFTQYLKVNAYANRAVIRPCNSNGLLLAKINGTWVVTQVNINLDARANPSWSTVCYANDILTPDSVVRPENGSIDAYNLKLCQALQHNRVISVKDL